MQLNNEMNMGQNTRTITPGRNGLQEALTTTTYYVFHTFRVLAEMFLSGAILHLVISPVENESVISLMP